MILTKITIQNYKKYREFELEFGEGLVGVIGKNGSGKSTIFDAITFALYGDARGEKQTIKNVYCSQKDVVKVELEFEIDGKSYKVVRELRGKALSAKAYLYDSKENLIATTSKAVTQEVTKLVGMNKEAFMHTVFASQKELTSLSELKNEDRKKIIRKLLGLEKIDKIELEIRTSITELNRDIKSFLEVVLDEKRVKEFQEELESKKKSLAFFHDKVKKTEIELKKHIEYVKSLDEDIKSLQKQKDEYIKLGNDLNLLKSKLENLSNNKDKAFKKLEELRLKQKQYDKDKSIMIEYEQLLKSIDEFQKQKERMLKKEGLQKEQEVLRTQYKQSTHEIQKLQKSVAKLPIMIEKKESLTKELNLFVKDIEKLEENERDILQVINKAKGLIENINKQVSKIVSIGRGSNCPTCTRPLHDEYDSVIESLKETIKKLQNDEVVKNELKLEKLQKKKIEYLQTKSLLDKKIKELDGDIKVLLQDEKNLKIKQNEFETIKQKGLDNKGELELLKDVQYDEKKHTLVLDKIESLKPKYEELLGVKRLLAQIPQLESEIKTLEKEIKSVEQDIKTKIKRVTRHSYDKNKHQAKEKEFAKAMEQKDSINQTLTQNKIELTKLEGQMLKIEDELKKDDLQKQKLRQKKADKDDYEKLKVLMSEFKNKINSHLRPRISLLASDMYAKITNGKYQHIEVNSEFDFFIYDDGKAYPIERFSGGEIDLANLVLRIAISKTLSELNGSGVGFLAFDEVFGSQDDERRMQIMEAFHSIKEQYRQIFLISHESEIKEMFEMVVEL